MTGFFIALAVLVAGSGEPATWQEFEKSNIVYERFYTGQECVFIDYTKVQDRIVRDCSSEDGDTWEKQFLLVFNLKDKSWERHRKTTLVWFYMKQRMDQKKPL